LPNNFRDHYDAIVIGGGLAGLTAANMLGRAGHAVLLVERHTKLGGLATSFRRPGGAVFDVALHGFPAGMIKSCRRYWNARIAECIVPMRNVRFDNPTFSLSTAYDRESFTRLLVERFAVAADTVAQFFDTARNMNFYDSEAMTTGELFERFFPGREDVVRLLMEPIACANGSRLEDPAIGYGIVFSNFMTQGGHIFRIGTEQLMRMMQDELLHNGVDIRCALGAESIQVEGHRVRGVTIAGRAVRARVVISNANLKGTICNLVGDRRWEAEFLEQARRVRLNSSSAQVYLALRPGEAIDEQLCGDLMFSSTAPRFSTELMLSRDITSRTYSFYYPRTRPDLDRTVIVASSNARYADWAGLSPDEYRASKQQLIESTLEALGKYVPDIRGKLAWAEAATPLTFQRYTGHLEGACFGTRFEGLAVSRAIPRQIAGLYHAGSVGIIMSGWLGAVNYGVIVANEADAQLLT
jgi:phytoene dehydrogenase-like protein